MLLGAIFDTKTKFFNFEKTDHLDEENNNLYRLFIVDKHPEGDTVIKSQELFNIYQVNYGKNELLQKGFIEDEVEIKLALASLYFGKPNEIINGLMPKPPIDEKLKPIHLRTVDIWTGKNVREKPQ